MRFQVVSRVELFLWLCMFGLHVRIDRPGIEPTTYSLRADTLPLD